MKCLFAFLLCSIFSVSGLNTLAFASAELVAPVYPDSVKAVDKIPDYLSDYAFAFYTFDPIEKVLDFYENELGSMEELREGNEYSYTVKKIRVGKAALRPDRLGVTIKTKKPAEDPREQYAEIEQDMQMASFRHDYFSPLEYLVAQLSERDWDDYNKAVERFIHLTWSYYTDSGKMDSRGRTMNLAQALIEDYHQSGSMEGAADSTEEMAARMEDLMQQGRIAEVQALAQQMHQQMTQAIEDDDSKWGEYLSVLEEIEKHAYKTLITIHRDVQE